MANVTTKTPQPTRNRRPLLIAGIAILLIACTAFGAHAYRQHALAADKARFTQAEKEIAELSAAITAATGQPLKVDSQKFCSRPHLKFEAGPLSCNVEELHFYGVENESRATELYKQISYVLQHKWRLSSSRNSDEVIGSQKFSQLNLSDYVATRDYERITENYEPNNGLNKYTVTYTLYMSANPPYDDYFKTGQSKYTIVYRLGFGDSAKAEYYPVNK